MAQTPGTRAWRFGDYLVDTRRGTLSLRDIEIPLRPKTWELLRQLVAKPGCLLGKDELIAALWPDAVASDDSLVQCVVELRRALDDRDKRVLRTVAKRGYRFEASVSEVVSDIPGASDGSKPTLSEAWEILRRIGGREAIGVARNRFEREHQMDPRSVPALVGIAMSHVIEILNRWSAAPAWQTELAKEAADRALGLTRSSAMAHHARAHVALLEGCHFEALAGYRKALELDPSLGHARLRMGLIELELGRPEAMESHARGALQCVRDDPHFAAQASFMQGMAAFHMGADDRALDCMRRSLVLAPGSGQAHLWLSAIDATAGREKSAAHHLALFRRDSPTHTIESLLATERSWNPEFRSQRQRLYDGLRRAGLPR